MDTPELPPRFQRVDVDALLREYRDKVPVKEIRKRHGLDHWSFYALLDRLNEPRRRPIGVRSRRPAVERLKKFTENEILKLERGIATTKDREGTKDDLAKLMSLARTLGQVLKLESGGVAGNDVARHAELVAITDERRRELARRLAALCGASGPAGSAEGVA